MSVITKWIAQVDFVEWMLKVLAQLAPALAILFWPLEVTAIRMLYPVELVVGMLLASALVEVRKLQLAKGKNFKVVLMYAILYRSLCIFLLPPSSAESIVVTMIYIEFLLVDVCILYACSLEREALSAVIVPTTPAPASEVVKTRPYKQ